MSKQGAWLLRAFGYAAFATGAVTAGTAFADGRLEGTVIQTEVDGRGLGVEGAIVRIRELNRETVTGRAGRFSFPALPAGNHTVEVEYLGEAKVEQAVAIADDETTQQTLKLVADAKALDRLTVVGQFATTNESLARQKAADNIRNVVTSDIIGDFPDTNAAEALQRMPGVSIERDQGEGRYVRIRGLGPDLNSVTINGAKVPSPESGSRAVALDVLPTELLESLEVSKTLTPDQDPDSLGGSINIKPLSAFDRDGRYYRVSGFGSFDDHTEKGSPKFAVAASDIFWLGSGNELGIAGGLSFESRDFGSDNSEAQDNWDFDEGAGYLEEFEQRDYTLTRERTGLTLNFDLHTASEQAYYLRYLNTGFSDTEQRLANVIAFLEEDDEGELDGTGILAGSTADAAEVERELKKRTEELDVISFVAGAENHLGQWDIDSQLAYSKASEDTPFNIDGAVFKGEFANIGFVDNKLPRPTGNYSNTDEYELDEIELGRTLTEDENTSVKVDFTRVFLLAEQPTQLKFGAKAAQREKFARENVWVLEDLDEAGFSDAELTLTPYRSGEVDYELGNFGPGIRHAALQDIVRDGRIDLDEYYDDTESQINNYDIQENILAGYAMLNVDMGNLRLLGGLRYEATEFTAEGYRLEDGVGADDVIAVKVDNDYNNVLPSLHARYRLNEQMQLRAAWSNSLIRPGFEQARAGAILEEDDDEIEGEFGNPYLDPTTASNIDLGFEWYLGRASALSIYAFYKDISDFIYNTDLAGTPGYTEFDGLEITQAEIAQNGKEASVYGLELSWVQSLGGGLLLSTNLTFSDSEATIEAADDGELLRREIPLPSQSDTVANISFGYEDQDFRVRVAANYKSSYLAEISDLLDSEGDIFADDHMQIDLTGRWFITRQLQLQFQALNLNDEPYYAYINKSGFNAQHEEYGPTYKVGLVYSSF